jgi:hypothetical protein
MFSFSALLLLSHFVITVSLSVVFLWQNFGVHVYYDFVFCPDNFHVVTTFSSYGSSIRLLAIATPAFFLQSLPCLVAARQFFVLSNLAATFRTASSTYSSVFRLALFIRDFLP